MSRRLPAVAVAMLVATPAFAQQAVTPSSSTSQAPVPQATAPQPINVSTNFLSRFFQAYMDGFNPPATDQAPAPRRGFPQPISSPPFPFGDYQYGGSPTIGVAQPNPTSYPLMTALYGGPGGQALKDSHIQIYGWIEPGVNISTNHHTNSPAGYDYVPNSVQMDQIATYIERVPDEVQTDHIDWGFRLANLWGTDYRYTTMNGLLSQQLLKHNQMYGDDPAMFYGDLYIPWVAQGMNIRAGRYISVPGIEAQLAPNNYFFSHSLLYTFDPFTDIGLLSTVKLNNNWTIQFGIQAGHDTMLGTSSAQPSGVACVSYTTSSNNDNIYACANGINGGNYAYNNQQHYDVTWYHRFNDRLHMSTEAYYMFQNNVPTVPTITGTLGAQCKTGTKCTAPVYAALNYFMYEISPTDTIGFRNEIFDDAEGARTGFKTTYSEHTVSWTHWLSTAMMVRPEVRFEHSYQRNAYDGGRTNSALTLASDMIIYY
jgi:Putative beta-barrel porin-2, OmpL-like. bbp2